MRLGGGRRICRPWPHPPFWDPGECRVDAAEVAPPIGAEDTDAVRQRRAHYLEKCALIDDYVGRLMEAL